MSATPRISIGTSGWSFESWKGQFYPKGLSFGDQLFHYTKHFSSVEVNHSFYSLPEAETVRDWCEKTPDNFLFSVKASRYLSHMKKLKGPDPGLSRLLEAVEPFGSKLGPILVQLPPSWKANPERLEHFLGLLPKKQRFTFEFRDERWHIDEIYDLLREAGAAFCEFDLKGRHSPTTVTADFVYLRLHGASERAYQGSYSDAFLDDLANRIDEEHNNGRDVFCYFDNDDKACAPGDAQRLLQRVEHLSS